MQRKEFLSICDSTLREMGFTKKDGAYYFHNDSDLVGAVFLRKSNFGSVYYVACTITIQGYNEAFPFPKYYDVDILTRFQFPLNMRLQYAPSTTSGYSVDLERNTEVEVREGITKGVEDWLLPALRGGKQYILDNWEKYSFHHLSEMLHIALEEWRISGIMPSKQNCK